MAFDPACYAYVGDPVRVGRLVFTRAVFATCFGRKVVTFSLGRAEGSPMPQMLIRTVV